ncbi:hypothetical protein N7457_004545, partial [Penicillium paradoxum]|uniref:uncharacterized protein n=1 Tax=Penicillium paradoxum TaxID=176176 RepID=UPI002547A66E
MDDHNRIISVRQGRHRIPASLLAVGVRVSYGLYWRKMAPGQHTLQELHEQDWHSPEQQLQEQGDMMNIDVI